MRTYWKCRSTRTLSNACAPLRRDTREPVTATVVVRPPIRALAWTPTHTESAPAPVTRRRYRPAESDSLPLAAARRGPEQLRSNPSALTMAPAMGLPELLKTVPYTIAEAGRGSTSFVHPIDAKQQQRRKRLSESDINSTSSTAAQTSGVAPINGAVSRQRFIEPSVAYAAPPAMRRCARSCSTWRALLEAYGYLTPEFSCGRSTRWALSGSR